MAKRKTINVNAILAEANKQLARQDEFATTEFKAGVCVILERILMDTGNYDGFNYNLWNNGGWAQWQKDGEPEGQEKEKYMYSKFGGQYDRCYY